MWEALRRIHNEIKTRFARFFRAQEVAGVLQRVHAQELAETPVNLWAVKKAEQAKEIAAVKGGNFDIVDRRSWAYPYIPEALHRLNQPILKNTPYNLRRFSETPIARRAINLIKNGVLSLKWRLKVSDDYDENDGELLKKKKIGEYTLSHPNDADSYRTLMEAVIEDFVIGGYGTMEPQLTPDYKHPFKLWSVDGSTIRIFADWSEATPERPRYAQLTGLKGERGIISFLDDELIYIRDNVRSSTPFGLGKLEVCFNCYSDDTEVLTQRGWISWQEARADDRYATRHPITGKFEWQLPKQIYKAHYNGPMVSFRGESADFLVTPNHRMFGHKYYGPKHISTDEFMPASEVANLPMSKYGYPFRVPSGSVWEGSLPPEMLDGLLTIKVQHDLGYEAWNKVHVVDLSQWVSFLGIYLAEGSISGSHRGIRKESLIPAHVQAAEAVSEYGSEPIEPPQRRYGVNISQSENSAHYADISRLLRKLPFDFVDFPSAHGFDVADKALHSTLAPLGNKYTKYVPVWVKELPVEYLEKFLDWYCKGDGNIQQTANGHIRKFFTVSKKLADDLVEMVQKCGKAATVAVIKSKGNLPNGRKAKSTAPLYMITERQQDFTTLGEASEIDYDGFVYCASVPNETLYIRRNGYPLWCGNTVNAFLGAQDMSTKAAADQVHKTWLWWKTSQAPGQMETVRRHLQNEAEGQAKISMMSGMPEPQVIDVTPVTPEDLLLDWQQFLIRVMAAGFDLSALSLGVEHDVNRNTAEVLSEMDFASAVVPVAKKLEEAITRFVFHRLLGWKEIEFEFLGLEDPNPLVQLEILESLYRSNATTPDEIREALQIGPPLPGGMGRLTMGQWQLLMFSELFKERMSQSGGMGGGPPGGGGGGGGAAGAGGLRMPSMAPPSMSMPSIPGAMPSGGQSVAAQSLHMGPFRAEDVAQMHPDDVHLYRQAGLLPEDNGQLTQEMEEQKPGILETISEDLREYFEHEDEVSEEDENNPDKVTAKDESEQKKRYGKWQHLTTPEEQMSRSIERQRMQLITRNPFRDRTTIGSNRRPIGPRSGGWDGRFR